MKTTEFLACENLTDTLGKAQVVLHRVQLDRCSKAPSSDEVRLVICLTTHDLCQWDEKHLVFECAALASLRSRYASLFTSSIDTMRSSFAQRDHMGVFHYVVDCLDFMKI